MGMAGSWPTATEAAAARKAAARRAGQRLLDESRDRAPELDGDLKDSAEMTELDDDAVRVGFDVPYAARQNYLDYDHPGGGQQFYLTETAEEIGPLLGSILADELRSRLS